MSESRTSAVLRALDEATLAVPIARKLLIAGSMGEGRELLRALGLRRSWIGWEVTTLRRLAMELVPTPAPTGGAVADPFEEQAAVDVALDEALERDSLAPLRELAEAPGFRQAVMNAVAALRLAGVPAARLRDAKASPSLVEELLERVQEGYQRALGEAGRIDAAEVMHRAARSLRKSTPVGFDAERVFLVPGLSRRGAAGSLATALLDAGATALRSDPVGGPVPPVVWSPAPEPAPLSRVLEGRLEGEVDLDLFAASGPAEEVREVLRRIVAADLRWDEVEIIATDPVVYGGALHALAERLGIPVSYAVGLPVERTGAGRAAGEYFRWIQSGCPADTFRRLLESGDLRPAGDAPPPSRLARRFRSLRIGWGAERYLPAIDRARDRLKTPRPLRNESEEEAAERAERELGELESLRSLLAPILATAPRLGGPEPGRVSPAEIARGLTTFLARVVAEPGTPSATARERMLGVAERVAATLVRPTEPAGAVAQLRRYLEIRVPAPQREGSAPWTSASGHLHLSDLEHGGHTGRAATFVVGLDADRFPGSGLQDPLLLDDRRRALDPVALPTSADRLAMTRFRMAACLARLRGAVTLSYSAWDPSEARAAAPSSVMLQAHRARADAPDATFEDLRAALGDAASAIPRGAALDGSDVWFGALESEGILRQGVEAVRGVHPRLDAGLEARSALRGEEATAHHGLVEPRPERLDPRRAEVVLSASGLEDLGTCARRYFYKYALRIRPPDDPEPDPDTWLDALDRGRLLHAVYEATLREARTQGLSAEGAEFVSLAEQVLEREARRLEREVPAPGAAVRERELRALRVDVRSFADMVAGRDGAWEALELQFGFRGEPPAPLELRGGTVRLRGAIDRVDRLDGGLTVVDYKTGGTGRHERRHGTFHGGRRLQNVVYAAVAESLLGGRVDRMEYHFPTRKGQNEVIGYSREELRRGLGLVDRLLDGVAAGRFLPTEEPGDCRFCDYAPVCRHRVEGWGGETPLADWAADRIGELPEYRERREARVWDETFLAELEEHGETTT